MTYPIIMLDLQSTSTAWAATTNGSSATRSRSARTPAATGTRCGAFYQPEKAEGAEKAGEHRVARETWKARCSAGKRLLHLPRHQEGRPVPLRPRRWRAASRGRSRGEDQRAYVVNVDPIESDLKRATRDDMEKFARQRPGQH